jgi:hypothetical protein
LLYQQQLGYAVLGTECLSKRPHRAYGPRGGVHWGTRDPAMMPWLWGQDRFAGIAVPTGSVNSLVVIDLDIKHWPDNGPAEFDRFLAEGSAAGWADPPLPEDVVTSTPSGGWHIWLRTPPGYRVPNRPGILPGVEIKGDGGYVMVPPSKVDCDGVPLPYSFARGCPCMVPPAPSWFLRWIEQATATGTVHGGGSGKPVPSLEDLKRAGIPAGERNTTLHQFACSRYRSLGSGSPQVLEELREAWQACDGAFPWHEVVSLTASARRWAAAQELADGERWQALSAWLARVGRSGS